jgi:hypothetical protein
MSVGRLPGFQATHEQDGGVFMPPTTAPADEIVTDVEIDMPSREDVLNLLDLDAFRAWLLKYPEWHVVGDGGDPDVCPVRNYLSDQGVPEPALSSSAVDWPAFDADARTCGRWQTLRVPEWCVRFLSQVDKRFLYTPVTAGQCLEVLRDLGI